MRLLRLLLLAALLVSVSAFAEEGPLLKIGVIAPLTGGLAPRGKDIVETLTLLEERLNEAPHKFKYHFVIEDGKCGLGSDATTIAQRFIGLEKMKFMITGCSGETLQAGPIAQREKVVLFAVLSNHKDVRKLGDYVFRTYPDIEDGIKLIAREMELDNRNAVAVLTEDNAFTQGMKAVLLDSLGHKAVFAEDFAQDVGDYRTVLLRMVGKKPDAAYLNTAADRTFQNLYSQLRDLDASLPAYGYYFAGVPDTLHALGARLDGIKYLDTPDIKDAAPAFKEFYEAYMQRNPQGPSAEFLVRTVYDAVTAIVSAAETTGADPAASKDFLYGYKTQGALGEVSFDEAGDVRQITYVVKQIQDGRPAAVKAAN